MPIINLNYAEGGNTSKGNPFKQFLASGRPASPEQQREVETNDFYAPNKGPKGSTIYIGDDGDDAFVKTADGQLIFIPDGRSDAVSILNSRGGIGKMMRFHDNYENDNIFERRGKYEQGGNTSKGKPNLVLPRESEGEVRRTEDGREYVMYRNEDTGEMVKVFGSWNEAPRVRERDEQGMGRFMSIDTSFNYPVTQNENGEFILDEAMLDTEQEGDGPTMVYDPEHGRKMPVAPVGNLLKQLEQQREGYSGVDKFSPTVRRGINMENGANTKTMNYGRDRMRTYRYGGRAEDGLTTNNPNGDPKKEEPITMESFAPRLEQFQGRMARLGGSPEGAVDSIGKKHNAFAPGSWEFNYKDVKDQNSWGARFGQDVNSALTSIERSIAEIERSGLMDSKDWSGSEAEKVYNELLKYIEPLKEASIPYNQYLNRMRETREGKNGLRTYNYGANTGEGETDPEKPKTKTVADFNAEDYDYSKLGTLSSLKDEFRIPVGASWTSPEKINERLATDQETLNAYASYAKLLDQLRSDFGAGTLESKWSDLEGFEGSELQELIREVVARKKELENFIYDNNPNYTRIKK